MSLSSRCQIVRCHVSLRLSYSMNTNLVTGFHPISELFGDVLDAGSQVRGGVVGRCRDELQTKRERTSVLGRERGWPEMLMSER